MTRAPLGYTTRKMKLYEYTDYDEYVNAQTRANKEKINNVWVKEKHVKYLSTIMTQHFKTTKINGLCHGTRNGKEQEYFMKYLPGSKVTGTEISTTANTFPNTIQHDFHEIKPEWKHAHDFIYSNSLDHAYDHVKALKNWALSVKPVTGMIILEWTKAHEVVNETDPFGASLKEYELLLCTVMHDVTVKKYPRFLIGRPTWFVIGTHPKQ